MGINNMVASQNREYEVITLLDFSGTEDISVYKGQTSLLIEVCPYVSRNDKLIPMTAYIASKELSRACVRIGAYAIDGTPMIIRRIK